MERSGRGALVWPEWFAKYSGRLGRRAYTMGEVAVHAPAQPLIVETGCVRTFDNWNGDGCSTVVFAEMAKERGGHLFSIDNSPDAISIARASIQPKGMEHYVTFIQADSVVALAGWSNGAATDRMTDKIDVLYLDSLDAHSGAADTAAQEHQALELAFAWPHLSIGALILLDDNITGGKTERTKKLLKRLGATLLADESQSLWQRREPTE